MSELVGNAGLTGIILIDIGIGVIFAILTFSLIASALHEAIAAVLNYRGEHLRKGILRLIDGSAAPQPDGQLSSLGRALLDHATIRGLKGPKNTVQWILQKLFIWGDGGRDEERMPSSIPQATFARALIETLVARKAELEDRTAGAAQKIDEKLDTIDKVIDTLALDARLKARLNAIVGQVDFTDMAEALTTTIDGTLNETKRQAAEALNKALIEIEADLALWFDEAMDRVTGWYVRRAKSMLFAIGFVMTAALGFDLIGYGKQLAKDDALRSAILAQANVTITTGQVGDFSLKQQDLNTKAAIAREKTTAGKTLDEEETRALAAAKLFNKDTNPKISDYEAKLAEATLRAAIDAVNEDAANAISTINATFADRGVTLDQPIWRLWGEWWAFGQLLLSALIIGLGCTMGGQFWFDLLKSVMKVRAGASGLNSDLQRLARELSPPRA